MIAGSDSSAGAGLQADIKTAQAFQVYAQTAVTAVTAQDTDGVHAVLAMPPKLVRDEIEAALRDIGADAVKIGMLANGAIISEVAAALALLEIPIVLDPVLASSSGAPLLDPAGIAALVSRLVPRASLVTPNLPEARRLSGERTVPSAARWFLDKGAKAVLVKGGHDERATVRDSLFDAGGGSRIFEAPRQESRHTHGTGCVLSTAIACGLACGVDLADAVGTAHDFVQRAIRTAPGLGKGRGPLNL